jgi:hypothetical protein
MTIMNFNARNSGAAANSIAEIATMDFTGQKNALKNRQTGVPKGMPAAKGSTKGTLHRETRKPAVSV